MLLIELTQTQDSFFFFLIVELKLKFVRLKVSLVGGVKWGLWYLNKHTRQSGGFFREWKQLGTETSQISRRHIFARLNWGANTCNKQPNVLEIVSSPGGRCEC